MDAKKVIKYVVFVVVVGNLALIGYVLLTAAAPKPAPLPNPNGYDDFVKAGSMLTTPKTNLSAMSYDELQAYVTANKSALDLGRVGVNLDCRMPDDYTAAYISRYLREAIALKALARAFEAEGKIARHDGLTNESVESYLAATTIGAKASHGGVMISKLVGIACETIGRNGLGQFTNSLDAKKCLKVSQALETLDQQEESSSEVLVQENKWMAESRTFRQKVEGWSHFISMHKQRNEFIRKCQKNTLDRRQLMLAFAARAYALDKGRPPASAVDLVPEYLKQIPQDPVTGTNLSWKQ